ncbi:MAG: hypothetical protein PUI72_02320, partial [Prevotellaceae bacterium]|nr:hypothetical protein [Prevotellaceae bacterium]MDY6200414.1 hypothetical protein [Prevotella sp.]
ALKGQKRLYKRLHDNAFAPSGRTSSLHHTQGDALGYVLVAPSGRALNACAYSLIQLTKLEIVILRVQEQFFLGYKNSFS